MQEFFQAIENSFDVSQRGGGNGGSDLHLGAWQLQMQMAHPPRKEWEREKRRAKQQTQLCLVIGLSRSRWVRRKLNSVVHVAFLAYSICDKCSYKDRFIL